MADGVRLDVDEARGVGTIRLDRPPMNALSPDMWREIEQCMRRAEEDERVRALVVWGGPKIFAAGADIKQFPSRDTRQALEQARDIHRAVDAVAGMPMVTIAAIHGYALGGGCELSLACDFRFVADNAKLGQPEILLGLVPGGGGTQRLPRLVGLSKAKELVYSGRMVDAHEAERIGLADRVLAADDLYAAAADAAEAYARGPYALRLAKRALDDGAQLPLDQGLQLEQELFAACFSTEDAATGIASFIEHGPGRAEFAGR